MKLIKKAVVCIMLLAALCVCLASCAKAPELPEEMPPDFAIRYTSQTYTEPNIYDTCNGLIQKDLMKDGAAQTSFTPSDETLRAIYGKVTECGIQKITREMTCSVITRGREDMRACPNTKYEITITVDGETYTVSGDSTAWSYTDSDKDARSFTEFVAFMKETLADEPAYRSLPDAARW